MHCDTYYDQETTLCEIIKKTEVMLDNYSLIQLIKHYAWKARDIDSKPFLAKKLLEEAYILANDKLIDNIDLQNQLKRDIAELKFLYGDKESTMQGLIDVGDGFKVGDYYLQQGKYEEALNEYLEFNKNGRFKDYWRLWKCTFLMERYEESLKYFELDTAIVIAHYQIKALAIAAVKLFNPISEVKNWALFNNTFPKTAKILNERIGTASIIEKTGNHWLIEKNIIKIHKRLIGRLNKPKLEGINESDFNQSEFYRILDLANAGIPPEYPEPQPTATSILQNHVKNNTKLNASTIVQYMLGGVINNQILEYHLDELVKEIDTQLREFELAHNSDFVKYFKDIIMGPFGFFFDNNEVYQTVKSILLSAEEKIRKNNSLPERGCGWVSEAEMIRLLKIKFSPLEVVTQHSPDWLQRLRYDAFIPQLNLAVEYQGIQHFTPVDIFGGDEGFIELVSRDDLKRELSMANGITVEYINYNQNIDEETTRLFQKYVNK